MHCNDSTNTLGAQLETWGGHQPNEREERAREEDDLWEGREARAIELQDRLMNTGKTHRGVKACVGRGRG